MSQRTTRSAQRLAATEKPALAVEKRTVSKRRNQRKPSPTPQQIELNIADENDSNDNNTNVTPPKQRKPCPKNESTSPSSLINRLSLIDKNENQTNAATKTTKPKSKIDNARKVLNAAEADELYGREKEIDELTEFLTSNAKNKTAASIYISGQPGTGKTACVQKLLKSSIGQQFQKVYINCTKLTTPTAVYRSICTELNIKLTTDKTANLQNIHNYICSSKSKMVLLVLDEIDELIEKKQSVLYTLFEWPTLPKAKIILIGIANSLDLTNRALARLQTQSISVKPQLMNFLPYTREQIVDIFKNRLEAAGVLDVFPMATLQLLSAKVAALSGDIRKALDLGRRVAEKAKFNSAVTVDELEDLGVSALDECKTVGIKEVLTVFNDGLCTANKWDDANGDAIPLQEKVLVCTLLLLLKKSKNKDITVGKLREIYAKVCTKRGIPSIDESEFGGMCSLTETKGIIRVIKNKVPRLSKIQLQWDVDEITNIVQDKQLIANILTDISVLDK